MMSERLKKAQEDIRTTDWEYYDGNHVWCRFCRATRPTVEDDDKLAWHYENCIYRIAVEEPPEDQSIFDKPWGEQGGPGGGI